MTAPSNRKPDARSSQTPERFSMMPDASDLYYGGRQASHPLPWTIERFAHSDRCMVKDAAGAPVALGVSENVAKILLAAPRMIDALEAVVSSAAMGGRAAGGYVISNASFAAALAALRRLDGEQ